MKNGIFKLDLASLADAALTAVAAALATSALAIVTAPGFDLFALNWLVVGHSAVNLAVIAAVVSLGKDLLTTSDGSLLNITPATSAAPNA